MVGTMYGKWFASTYTGSMMGAGAAVFAVWGWAIANAGPSGVVEINPKLLAAVIGEPESTIEEAVNYLLTPDPSSRSSAEGGRRLIHEGGFQYRIVNHAVYRAIRDEEQRREYNRKKQAESRQRRASNDVKR